MSTSSLPSLIFVSAARVIVFVAGSAWLAPGVFRDGMNRSCVSEKLPVSILVMVSDDLCWKTKSCVGAWTVIGILV